MTSFDLGNSLRAAAANAADAASTEADIEALIAWHERESAVHSRAIETLRKALSHTAMVKDACRTEATAVREQITQQQAAPEAGHG